MAVTWRNVAAANLAGSLNALNDSGATLSSGLNTLAKLGGQIRQDNIAAYDRVTDTNTDNLLGQISEMRNIGQYQDAVRSGAFSDANLKQQYGDQFDAAKIRAALAGQDETIRAQETADYNAGETLRNRADAPLIAQAQQNIMGAKNEAEYNAALQAAGDLGISTQGMNNVSAFGAEFLPSILSDENRRQQNAADRLIRGTNIEDLNREVVSDNAGRYAAFTNDTGINIVDGEYDLSAILDNIQDPAIKDKTREQLTNQFDTALIDKYGLEQLTSVKEQEESMRDQLLDIGLDSTEAATNLNNWRTINEDIGSLTQGSQARVAAQVANNNALIDETLSQSEAELQSIIDLNPTDPNETIRQRSVTLDDVMAQADEQAPDSSWLDELDLGGGGINRQGGTDLKDEIYKLSEKTFERKDKDGNVLVSGKVEPWMIQAALNANMQTDANSWGNPTADINGLEKMVRNLALDTEGKFRQALIADKRAQLNTLRLQAISKKSNDAARFTKDAKKEEGIQIRSSDDIFRRRNLTQ